MKAAAGHRLVPHTADVALEAWAPAKYECVIQAVHALVGGFAELMERRGGRDEPAPASAPAPVSAPALRVSVSVPIDPASDDDLLVAVLDEVIYQVEVHGRVPVDATLAAAGEAVDVRFETVPIDTVRIIGAVPKAVSLHQLRFGRVDGGWRCHVTVDV
jgi:SHS2 domain-containing protein